MLCNIHIIIYSKIFFNITLSYLMFPGDSDPLLLSKWRANRASEFVSTQKNPLQPPTHR